MSSLNFPFSFLSSVHSTCYTWFVPQQWYFNSVADNHDACTKLATSAMHFNLKRFVCSLMCIFKYSGKLAKNARKKTRGGEW